MTRSNALLANHSDRGPSGDRSDAMIWICGSLRRGSQIQSSSVQPAQLMLLAANAQLQVETIRGIPLDVGDREVLRASRKPLKEAIAGRHGLLLATPEYNDSPRARAIIHPAVR